MSHPAAFYTRRDALALLGAAATLPGTACAQPVVAAPVFPKGAVIRAILRDYAPDELAGGATLFHEHLSMAPDLNARNRQFTYDALVAGRPPHAPVPPAPLPAAPMPTPDFMRNLDLMTEEISIARREGIGCIVDGGHPDMGRDTGFLRQLSEKSGMPIVVGAGFYTQPFYPAAISAMNEDQVLGALLAQVHADPIGAFGEIGSFAYISQVERKVFRAVGRAHLATNIPIFTHTGVPGRSAIEQLDLLEDEGVDPKRVAIGHLGNLVDPHVDVQREICRRGAFVGFDRQGGPSDDLVVPMAMTLIADGYAGNLLFSSDFGDPRALKRNQGLGYAKTLTAFVPKMRAAGASDAVLHQIMNDNPRRFLAFVPKLPRPA